MSESSTDIKREFVHATYCRSKTSDQDDLLVVKEYLHHQDGKKESNLRFIKNYERSFFITQKQYRDHEQKKEFEYRDRCDEYRCPQAQVVKKAARLLDMWGARRLSEVNSSPYLYGTDITTPVLLCEEYRRYWPDIMSDSTLAVMDYETDVLNGTNDIISGTISFKERICLAVTRDFLGRYLNTAQEEIQEAFIHYLGEYAKTRKITLEVKLVDTCDQVVSWLFKRAHEWRPDFLGFWNMKFDIGRIMVALKKNDVSFEDVFSDPSVPREYRFFNWREDEQIKTTADGKQISKHIADLWHEVSAPASFQCVDLMCLFKRLRVREKQRNSYSLDAILGEELKISKLKFKEADGLSKLDWHIFMQRNYKIEYLIYNIFDCISVELLDELTGDVSRGLRPAADISEIKKLASNPKRLSDTMYFILRDEGKVIASVSSDMTEEFDRYTPHKKNWINNTSFVFTCTYFL